jgi:hypothetical protein
MHMNETAEPHKNSRAWNSSHRQFSTIFLGLRLTHQFIMQKYHGRASCLCLSVSPLHPHTFPDLLPCHDLAEPEAHFADALRHQPPPLPLRPHPPRRVRRPGLGPRLLWRKSLDVLTHTIVSCIRFRERISWHTCEMEKKQPSQQHTNIYASVKIHVQTGSCSLNRFSSVLPWISTASCTAMICSLHPPCNTPTFLHTCIIVGGIPPSRGKESNDASCQSIPHTHILCFADHVEPTQRLRLRHGRRPRWTLQLRLPPGLSVGCRIIFCVFLSFHAEFVCVCVCVWWPCFSWSVYSYIFCGCCIACSKPSLHVNMSYRRRVKCRSPFCLTFVQPSCPQAYGVAKYQDSFARGVACQYRVHQKDSVDSFLTHLTSRTRFVSVACRPKERSVVHGSPNCGDVPHSLCA